MKFPQNSEAKQNRSEKLKQKFMQRKPTNTLQEMMDLLKGLGGEAYPELLLLETGLSENIDRFFDLLREGRDNNLLSVPVGATDQIKSFPDAY